MGFVWNVMLSFDNEEYWEEGEDQPRDRCEPLERINQWIPYGKLVDLVGPTHRKGAGFGMDANLFGGGYKNFDIERFIKVVEAQPWKERAKVQLWVKGAEEGMGEEPFTVVRLGRRRVASSTRARAPEGKSRARVKGKLRSRSSE
jgi:hypothetical protein